MSDFSTGANGVEFATIACGFLDPATGELSYASAGHPPALVVSPGGGVQWLDGGRSTPVGAVSLPCERSAASYRLGSGDLLILYSTAWSSGAGSRSAPDSAGWSRPRGRGPRCPSISSASG